MIIPRIEIKVKDQLQFEALSSKLELILWEGPPVIPIFIASCTIPFDSLVAKSSEGTEFITELLIDLPLSSNTIILLLLRFWNKLFKYFCRSAVGLGALKHW
jgi:hypothetical protein